MFNSLTHLNISFLELAIRAVTVYLTVLILLRLSGKREMGQMGPTEFVAVLLISNAVQNAMNGGDNSLVGGLWLACILIFLSALISFLTYRLRLFRTLFEGTPTLLVHNGKLIPQALRRERMTMEELRTLMRKQGVSRIQDLKTAILESDGTLSILHKDDPMEPSEPL